MKNNQYILDEHGNPKVEPDLLRWAAWFENTANRIVRQDMINGVKISTVFLGLDHNFGLEGPPILWETMIFGGKHDQYQERYATVEDAQLGHLQALEMVQSESI